VRDATKLDVAAAFPIRRFADEQPTDEYNCKLNRLLPWPGTAETRRQINEFGVIWVTVAAGDTVDTHEHDEEEAFLFVSGTGRVIVDGQMRAVSGGDLVYVDRCRRHSIIADDQSDLVFIDIYWDLGTDQTTKGAANG
jgi:mannose-6-phosphate isomerase-like protein (cupin superfamily)